MSLITFSGVPGSPKAAAEFNALKASQQQKAAPVPKTLLFDFNEELDFAAMGAQFPLKKREKPNNPPAIKHSPAHVRLKNFKTQREAIEQNTRINIPDDVLLKVFERYPWVSDAKIREALEKRISTVFRKVHKSRHNKVPIVDPGQVLIDKDSNPIRSKNNTKARQATGFHSLKKHDVAHLFPNLAGEPRVGGSLTLKLDHVTHLFPKSAQSFIPPEPSIAGVTLINTSSFPKLSKTSGNSELKEFIETRLKAPYKYPSLTEYKEPTVLLLHGPPGGGKTHGIGCLAEELKQSTGEPVALYHANGSQLRQKYHSENRQFVEGFLRTGENLPENSWRILFLDEATPGKEGDEGNKGAMRETNNALKDLLEGMETKTTKKPYKTLIVFATNHIDAFEEGLIDRAKVIHMAELSEKAKKRAFKDIFRHKRLLQPPGYPDDASLEKILKAGLRQLGDVAVSLRNKTAQFIMEDRTYKPERKQIGDALERPTRQTTIPQPDKPKPKTVSSRQLKNLKRRTQKIKQQMFLEELTTIKTDPAKKYATVAGRIVELYPQRYAHISGYKAKEAAAEQDYTYAVKETKRIDEKRKQRKSPPDLKRRQAILDKVAAIPRRGYGSYDPKNPEHVKKREKAFVGLTLTAIKTGLQDIRRKQGKNQEKEKPTRKKGRVWLPVPKHIMKGLTKPEKASVQEAVSSMYF